MVRRKILQIFPANLQTLVINVNPIKNSQIKINIASNETMDVFGLDWQYWQYSLFNILERTRAEPVVLPMENVTVYRGENASLTCKASSDSMPHFQWLRWFPLRSNGSANSSADDSIETPHYEIVNKEDTDQHVILPPSDGKMFDFHGAKLTLFNVTKRDEGKYTCIVGNAVGYAVEHTYIIVQKMGR